LYDRSTDFEILKYDSTFALSIDQLKTIIYSKHYNKRRVIGAQSPFAVGTALTVFPVLFGILLYKDIAVLAPYYGGSIVAGFILTYYSKFLYRSMVPKPMTCKSGKLKLSRKETVQENNFIFVYHHCRRYFCRLHFLHPA
jgi:hypothetical protein